jgi:hypothetical protein
MRRRPIDPSVFPWAGLEASAGRIHPSKPTAARLRHLKQTIPQSDIDNCIKAYEYFQNRSDFGERDQVGLVHRRLENSTREYPVSTYRRVPREYPVSTRRQVRQPARPLLRRD